MQLILGLLLGLLIGFAILTLGYYAYGKIVWIYNSIKYKNDRGIYGKSFIPMAFYATKEDKWT